MAPRPAAGPRNPAAAERLECARVLTKLLTGRALPAVGAPVFPRNLLLVGHRGPCAIMGAPGCARHLPLNVVDLVLPRLLIGEKIQGDDVAALGLGGFIAR